MKIRYFAFLALQFSIFVQLQAANISFDYGTGELKPGEIVISEFFEDLIRIDPITGDRFNVPLGDTRINFFTDDIEIDRDGQLIFIDDDDRLIQFNPATSVSTVISPPFEDRLDAFALAPDGAIIGLNRDQVIRFDPVTRETQTMDTSEVNGGFFSPSALAVAPTGEIYVGEFFEGLWSIDLETESAIEVPVRNNAVEPDGDAVAAGPNGELFFLTRRELVSLDPTTGAFDSFAFEPPTFTSDVAVDGQGRLLIAHSDGVDRYDPITGVTEELVSDVTFFSANSIAVFVPEPCQSVGFALVGLLIFLRVRRSENV